MTIATPDIDLEGAPEWFIEAISRPQISQRIATSDGYSIHYIHWPSTEERKPVLLFLHGYRGSTHAWDFIAPFFADKYRVYAMDLGGMGDTDHRNSYDMQTFYRDLSAVIDVLDASELSIVGHSFGGACGLYYLDQQYEKVDKLIVVDSYMHFADEEIVELPPRGRPVPFDSYADITARYRLLPEQPVEPWMYNFMAFHSVKKTPKGWAWKFDTKLPGGKMDPFYAQLLSKHCHKCRFVHGEKSAIVDTNRARRIETELLYGKGFVTIPCGHHHLMLDQPIALITALRALLAQD